MQQGTVENVLPLRRNNLQGRWKERERRMKDYGCIVNIVWKAFQHMILVKKPEATSQLEAEKTRSDKNI